MVKSLLFVNVDQLGFCLAQSRKGAKENDDSRLRKTTGFGPYQFLFSCELYGQPGFLRSILSLRLCGFARNRFFSQDAVISPGGN
jgi:hypothetical protein